MCKKNDKCVLVKCDRKIKFTKMEVAQIKIQLLVINLRLISILV